MTPQVPTLADVFQARRTIAPLLPRTPCWSYPALDALVGATVYVKHENVQPIGAFKVRGGLNLVAPLSPDELASGIVTYSTGNHAQSIAYAARARSAECVTVMPEGANPGKVRAVEALGAKVALQGDDMAGAQAYAEELAASKGARLVSPADEPALIAGVATLYVELFEEHPELDAVLVPVGSGTGAAGACIVAEQLAPTCRVIGVQSDASPAAHDGWRSGTLATAPNRTRIEGLATGRAFALPQQSMRTGLSDFVLVSDEQIAAAQRILATHAHTLAEGAGASTLAAVLASPDLAGRNLQGLNLQGKNVAIICTGGNASPTELAALGTP